VKFFLDNGADPNLRGEQRSPLQVARSLETKTQWEKDMKEEIVTLLLGYGAIDNNELDEVQLNPRKADGTDYRDGRVYGQFYVSLIPPGIPTFATLNLADL
jgi:hypothetical protein